MLGGRDSFAEATLPRLRSQLSYLVRSASLELTPREARDMAPYRRFLYPGTRVYIPHLPGTRVSDAVAAARALASDGMVPVPHIAARRLGSVVEFTHLLDQLREVGCNEALVVGGGARRPAGPFISAMDLLQSGAFEDAGFRRIGIAGHPEGSPDIPDVALRDAFLAKSRLAERGTFEMYVVTQFCFDFRSIVTWEKSARNPANRLPIHVGLPGVTSGAKLLRFAAICGVRASAGFLRQGAPTLGRLLTRWSPSTMVAEIAAHTLHDPSCMIRQFHFFPFGGFLGTVAWMKAIGEGRYTLENSVDGLVVIAEEADS